MSSAHNSAPKEDSDPEVSEAGARVLGWFCEDVALGRPGVQPLFLWNQGWSSEAAALRDVVASRRARRFEVFDFQGERTGRFDVAGAAQLSGRSIATGAFVGAGICTKRGAEGRESDKTCEQMSIRCSLAVASTESVKTPYEEDAASVEWGTGKACVVGDVLQIEEGKERLAFSLQAFARDPSAQPKELPTMPALEKCSSAFRLPPSRLRSSEMESEMEIELLGVIDATESGRSEIVLRQGQRIFLYGRPSHPRRMELLAGPQL